MARIRPVLLCLLATTPAFAETAEGERARNKGEPDRAHALLRAAIRAQGRFSEEDVRDVRLSFRGQATTPDRGSHVVEREYWYRREDRSFRVRTAAGADGSGSERGVLGRRGYWERGKNGIRALRARNREDLGSVKTIRKERREFERMFGLVLLSRLDDEDASVRFAGDGPVRIEKDEPFDAHRVFKDRTRTFRALEVRPKDEPRFVLFVDTNDKRIRKVVQYSRKDPGAIDYVYYFGAYRRNDSLGLVLPRYFSVHTAVPTDRKSREETNVVHGRLKLSLNEGLETRDLRPDTGEE